MEPALWRKIKMKFLTVREVMKKLRKFPPGATVFIESSNGEYGPSPVEEIHVHAGKEEPYGVNRPGSDNEKGCPVIT